MGILGLQTFMKCNGCCEQVKLGEIADAYRSETGEDPVLLVDLSTCTELFYTSNPNVTRITGELKKYKENFINFMNNCKMLGITLKFFERGKKPPYMYEKWNKGVAKKIEKLGEVYSGQTITSLSISYRGALYWILDTYLLLRDDLEVFQASYDVTDDIHKYTKTKECFAVLTNNSDFIVMKNIHYCLTPVDLNLHSMTFFNFNRSNLANLLKINPSQLPLFASLCLSFLPCFDLATFYEKERIKANDFFRAADIIKDFTSKEELVQYIFSLMQADMTLLETRLKFYLGEEQEGVRCTPRNHWDEILNFGEKRHFIGQAHPQILSVIQDKVMFVGFTSENVLVPLAEQALRKFRKKIYGILFFENPDPLIFVTEFVHVCLQEGRLAEPKMRTVIVERCSHPGLLKLWSVEKSDDLEILRKSVFCEAINSKLTVKHFSRLNIPLEYVFPVLAAFYLLWEFDGKFEEFEVEIVLIQAVLANRLTSEQICQLPEEFHIEALNLAGWFCQTVDNLRFLSSVCGEPFCKNKTTICNFFDGKVMHYVYGKVKEGENPWKSFDQYETEYRTLNSVLYELGRICGHVEPKMKEDSVLNGNTTEQ